MAGIKIHTAETEHVVDTDDLKNHLKITGTDDNDTLDIIRVTVHNWAKNYTQRSLTTQTIQLFIDSIYQADRVIEEGKYVGIDQDINRRSILLPFSPVASVTHFKSYDDSDNATTFASSKYYVSTASSPAKLTLRQGESYPTGLRVADAFEIQYVAGYGGRTSVPTDIRNACLLYASHLFENRGDGLDGKAILPPPSAIQLLRPYKIIQFSTNPFRGTASFGGLYSV